MDVIRKIAMVAGRASFPNCDSAKRGSPIAKNRLNKKPKKSLKLSCERSCWY